MAIEKQQIIDLLCKLIQLPSLSRAEEKTADLIEKFLRDQGCPTVRTGHNIISRYTGVPKSDSYVFLCSHHDTVRPNSAYTRDPFSGEIEAGKIFGLGANDAGASLVSLMYAFIYLAQQKSPCNLILATVAEEEISGPGGVASILEQLPTIDLAIVGEPTQMQMAVAEKGLVVIDGLTSGVPGHAAHENTVNPIEQACADIQRIQSFVFDRVSHYLGKTKANVTVINAGEYHNQVPAECRFVIDVRANELYTLEEVVVILQGLVESRLTPRSLRLKPSGIGNRHRIIEVAKQLSIPTFGSATLSDQAIIPFPSIKIGPGDSLRSHTADEYVYLNEIDEGIEKYIQLITAYSMTP